MKTKETKIINQCWDRLVMAFDPVSYHKHVNRLLDISLEESKQHDRFRGDSIPRGISVRTEAKYFAIKRLYNYYHAIDDEPRAINYMCWQKSCYVAFALARSEETKEYVHKWLSEENNFPQEIASWDYSDLIKNEDRRHFASSEFHQNNLKEKICNH